MAVRLPHPRYAPTPLPSYPPTHYPATPAADELPRYPSPSPPPPAPYLGPPSRRAEPGSGKKCWGGSIIKTGEAEVFITETGIHTMIGEAAKAIQESGGKHVGVFEVRAACARGPPYRRPLAALSPRARGRARQAQGCHAALQHPAANVADAAAFAPLPGGWAPRVVVPAPFDPHPLLPPPGQDHHGGPRAHHPHHLRRYLAPHLPGPTLPMQCSE